MQNRRRFMSSLGARLRKRRLATDLTIEALSKRTGIAKSFLSQVENGISQPTALPLLNLSRALGVTADWLLTGVA